tara:strand:+ start:1550 stop:1813 length:264 start_codon:yes stop_codon:yes gene_type:complete
MTESQLEEEMRNIWNKTKEGTINRHLAYGMLLQKIKRELKRCYGREDELIEALQIIRDDLDEALEVYPILNKEDVEKVRNFANDASL